MKSRGEALVTRQVSRQPPRQPRLERGAIGFAVRDVAGRGCAFEIDEAGGEALVFGATSPLRVRAPGVLPAHFVVLPHDGVLVAASASAATPAVLNGAPLPTTWTVLEVPSRVRIGAAAVDFFFIRESGTVLVDLDVETTVADSGVTSLRVGRPHADVASTAREAALAGWAAVRTLWTRASMSTRVLLVVVGLLGFFMLARSSGGDGSEARARQASEASAAAIPTAVPVSAVHLLNDSPPAIAASAVPGVQPDRSGAAN